MKKKITHVDRKNRPGMVDVSEKQATHRTAIARAVVKLPTAVRALLQGAELVSPKGPVFQTAIIAGTQAVKRTAELIPFCHPLPIESCRIAIELTSSGDVNIVCTVSLHHKTGVEMEAMTGAAVAALTIYDMCKGISHNMVISEVSLVEKTGGKSDVRR